MRRHAVEVVPQKFNVQGSVSVIDKFDNISRTHFVCLLFPRLPTVVGQNEKGVGHNVGRHGQSGVHDLPRQNFEFGKLAVDPRFDFSFLAVG